MRRSVTRSLSLLAGIAVTAYLVLGPRPEDKWPPPQSAEIATASDERPATGRSPSAITPPATAPGPGVPVGLVIPRLDVNAPVYRINMSTDRNDPDYRTLVPPENSAAVGWWAEGPRPGASRGSALILGHTRRIPGVAGTGDGVLGRISQLHVGDRIEVVTDTGDIDFRVTEVLPDRSYQQVSRLAGEITDPDYPGGRLVLITCWYDGQAFTGNTFVIAELA